ncbi:hypothetical protein DITRI_Ditri13aG0053200 [Diplodiscus trichospermus]
MKHIVLPILAIKENYSDGNPIATMPFISPTCLSSLSLMFPERFLVPVRAFFGASAKSMQCSYDERGNSVPTILLMIQRRVCMQEALR